LASAALAQAGEAYGGALLDGVAYGWVEGPREDTRRWAVDALARLAELRQAADDLPGAVEALERAIIADPVAEELYRRLMRLQADLERPMPCGAPTDLWPAGWPSCKAGPAPAVPTAHAGRAGPAGRRPPGSASTRPP